MLARIFGKLKNWLCGRRAAPAATNQLQALDFTQEQITAAFHRVHEQMAAMEREHRDYFVLLRRANLKLVKSPGEEAAQ